MIHGCNLKVNPVERFSPNVVFEMNYGAKVQMGRRVRAHGGCKFKVRKNGELILEDGVKINYYCIFVCREMIKVGAGTEFGPSVVIYDHDHDYRVGLKKEKFKSTPITIGKNCWIGANTIVLRGSTIGDNCVIGAGCVIRGEIPSNTICFQRRDTEIKYYDIS